MEEPLIAGLEGLHHPNECLQMGQRKLMAKLSSKLFRERALAELLEIQNEIADLATDKDIYWQVQGDVIQRNAKLI